MKVDQKEYARLRRGLLKVAEEAAKLNRQIRLTFPEALYGDMPMIRQMERKTDQIMDTANWLFAAVLQENERGEKINVENDNPNP
jgi:hypothetical protein